MLRRWVAGSLLVAALFTAGCIVVPGPPGPPFFGPPGPPFFGPPGPPPFMPFGPPGPPFHPHPHPW